MQRTGNGEEQGRDMLIKHKTDGGNTLSLSIRYQEVSLYPQRAFLRERQKRGLFASANKTDNKMSNTELQKEGAGFSVATVGDLATFEGKTFVKEIMGTTSIELSSGSLAPGAASPFVHHHKQNEEVYVALSGTGVLTLNKEEIPVASGSIVRVAPEVSRHIRCTGTTPLVYICIQGKAGSLEQFTLADGVLDR